MKSLYPDVEEYKEEATITSKEGEEIKGTAEKIPSKPIIHTITEFDTLDGLSIKYGVSKDSIRQANKFSGDNIYSFKTLQIPFSKGQIYHSTVTYDVESLRKREATEVLLKILRQEYQRFPEKLKGIEKEAKYYLESTGYNLKASLKMLQDDLEFEKQQKALGKMKKMKIT